MARKTGGDPSAFADGHKGASGAPVPPSNPHAGYDYEGEWAGKSYGDLKKASRTLGQMKPETDMDGTVHPNYVENSHHNRRVAALQRIMGAHEAAQAEIDRQEKLRARAAGPKVGAGSGSGGRGTGGAGTQAAGDDEEEDPVTRSTRRADQRAQRTRGEEVAPHLPGKKLYIEAERVHNATDNVIKGLRSVKDPVLSELLDQAHGHLHHEETGSEVALATAREHMGLRDMPSANVELKKVHPAIFQAHKILSLPYVQDAAKAHGLNSELPDLFDLRKGSDTARIFKEKAKPGAVINVAGKQVHVNDLDKVIDTSRIDPTTENGQLFQEKLDALKEGSGPRIRKGAARVLGADKVKAGKRAANLRPVRRASNQVPRTRISGGSTVGVTPRFEGTQVSGADLLAPNYKPTQPAKSSGVKLPPKGPTVKGTGPATIATGVAKAREAEQDKANKDIAEGTTKVISVNGKPVGKKGGKK